MPRRRSYTDADLAVAAKQVFWERGYEGTAVDDLQEVTGLSRSSLYLAFGTKRAVFDAALGEYVMSFIEPRIGPVEAPTAGPREAAAFFRGLAQYFRRPDADRGCLMINSIAELAGRDPSFSPVAESFTNRLRAAFSHALEGGAAATGMTRKQIARRADMLTASTLGVWLTVRSDAAGAASTCRAIADEITAWSPSPQGSEASPGTSRKPSRRER
ncbi:MAG: TetR/AcrR family transcriptional regulator, transcriptional repressor for nem operon [Actinomycetota bacterium]|jgi:AcrR family transcriptional regulator